MWKPAPDLHSTLGVTACNLYMEKLSEYSCLSFRRFGGVIRLLKSTVNKTFLEQTHGRAQPGRHTQTYRAQDTNMDSKWKQRWAYSGSVYDFKIQSQKKKPKRRQILFVPITTTPQKITQKGNVGCQSISFTFRVCFFFFEKGQQTKTQTNANFLFWWSDSMFHNTFHQP